MAISKDKWNKAKEYFEAGLSLTDIVDRTGISKSQISKKASKDNWEKGNEKKQLISQAVDVAIKKETLKETALEVHDELVSEAMRNRNLVFGVTQKALKKLEKMVDTVDNASDLKTIIDASDRASLTLKVNERFAKTENNNINAFQQVSEIKISDA